MTDYKTEIRNLTTRAGRVMYLASGAFLLTSPMFVNNMIKYHTSWECPVWVLWCIVIFMTGVTIQFGKLMSVDYADEPCDPTLPFLPIAGNDTNIHLTHVYIVMISVYIMFCFLTPTGFRSLDLVQILEIIAPIIIPLILLFTAFDINQEAYDLRYNNAETRYAKAIPADVPVEDIASATDYNMQWCRHSNSMQTLLIFIDSGCYELGALSYRKYDDSYIFVPKILPLLSMTTPQIIQSKDFDTAMNIISGIMFTTIANATPDDIESFTKGK